MDLKIGVDIEDIARFRALPFSDNGSFYERVFTAKEIAYCTSKKDPYQHFAARFCAKEALVKAVGNRKIDFRDVEVEGTVIRCGKISGKVSLAHEKDKAIAFVLV